MFSLEMKKNVKVDLIKRAITDYIWENKLSFIGINNKVVLFNENTVNILSNFIPNETMIFDNRKTLHGLTEI